MIDSAMGKKLGEELAMETANRIEKVIGDDDKKCQRPKCQLKCTPSACMVPSGFKDFEPLEEGWKIIKSFEAPPDPNTPKLQKGREAPALVQGIRRSQTLAVEVLRVARKPG